MKGESWSSRFDQIFDVAIVGGGYAGFAAALRLSALGQRVLLVDRRGDLVWESGRAFALQAGALADPLWTGFVEDVAGRGGAAGDFIDGAIAEVVATTTLVSRGVNLLYYAYPVDVERDGTNVAGLIVATRSGLRRIAARQWIDATERGDLLRLLSPHLKSRQPAGWQAYLYLQHPNWGDLPGLLPTAWPNQRCVVLDLKSDRAWRKAIIPALQALPASAQQAILSHCSVEPLPCYDAGDAVVGDVGNVACAAAAMASQATQTLADRFALGLSAASRLGELPAHEVTADELRKPITPPPPSSRITTEVLVAGAGTGGAVAAIAAGRSGAKVTCIDPMPFVGGIGTGGGIHMYYFGVVGGLQQEIDRNVKQAMTSAGRTLSGGPFNPEAKKIVLERMLREANVDLQTDLFLYDVECQNGRVVRAFSAGPDGPVEIVARAWIDATGDGDLCVRAGASFTLGRQGDGLLHAYSQSAGALRERHDGIALQILNFDAGWCDPGDPEDLTRARIAGISHYLRDRYDAMARPTYIAPAIGLRQSRQIETDYLLQLDDLIRQRRFEDVVGFTGCHYDNHAVDYQFESDEALFWVWALQCWHEPIGCEISYRMLLPRGLRNVWIASRALGVSQDAHHCTRMQRDIQRVGEVAGWAAAIAVADAGEVDIRRIPYAALRQRLEATGALDARSAVDPNAFGDAYELESAASDATSASIAAGMRDRLGESLAMLDAARSGAGIWWLYRHPELAAQAVRQRLGHSDPRVSWLAACVCAMWGEATAEPRLLKAIESQEYGFDESELIRGTRCSQAIRPDNDRRVAPRWLVAAAMLRRCGTLRCLPALEKLSRRSPLPLDVRTTIATTLERLAHRGQIGDVDRALAILERLEETPITDTRSIPARPVGALVLGSDHGAHTWPLTHLPKGSGDWWASAIAATTEDHGWQADLALARARIAMGLPAGHLINRRLHDDRVLVRRCFGQLTKALREDRHSALTAEGETELFSGAASR